VNKITYEHKDFVYRWKVSRRPWRCVTSNGDFLLATLEWWQGHQSWLLPKLQKYLDQGWEPLTEVGPNAYVTRDFKSLTKATGCLDALLMFCVVIGTFGFGLFFIRSLYTEAVEFRVKLRRPVREDLREGEVQDLRQDPLPLAY